jgi:hypothetical protein
MTDDVSDHQRHRPVGQRHRVEPITTGCLIPRRHQIAARQVDSRQHGQGGGQQCLLHLGHHIPGRLVAPFRLRRPALGRLPLPDLLGDIHPVQGHPHDGAVGRSSGRRRDVDEELAQLAGPALVELHPPLPHRLRRTGLPHPVENVVDLLTQQLREHFRGRVTDDVLRTHELPVHRIDRVESMLSPGKAAKDDRNLLERLKHRLHLTHRRLRGISADHPPIIPRGSPPGGAGSSRWWR